MIALRTGGGLQHEPGKAADSECPVLTNDSVFIYHMQNTAAFM